MTNKLLLLDKLFLYLYIIWVIITIFIRATLQLFRGKSFNNKIVHELCDMPHKIEEMNKAMHNTFAKYRDRWASK